MGLISSLIGLGLGAAAVQGAAESHDVRKGWMRSTEKKRFDELNAREGIQVHRITDIARRCKVKTNKYGVLPKGGYVHCLNYVRRYANSEDDIDKFIANWKKVCDKQIREMPIKVKSSKSAQKYLKTAQSLNEYKANMPNTTLTHEIVHWRNLSKDEHLKRMHEIATQTALKHVLYQPPILRWNDMIRNMYTEFWTVYVDPKNTYSILGKKYFKNTYTKCAAYLGYDAEL